MTRIIQSAIALVVLVLLQVATVRAAEPVDLLLVLASDVSRSVDHPKFLLQREGYASAVSNPQVLDAIKSGAHGKIGLCFIEWSGYGAQKVVIGYFCRNSSVSRALNLPRPSASSIIPAFWPIWRRRRMRWAS